MTNTTIMFLGMFYCRYILESIKKECFTNLPFLTESDARCHFLLPQCDVIVRQSRTTLHHHQMAFIYVFFTNIENIVLYLCF